jgi:hypothetical protein
MGPPSCMRSVVDRNVVMRRVTGHGVLLQTVCYCNYLVINLFICDNRKEAVQYYVSNTITSDSNTTSNPKDALYSSVKEHLTSSDPRPTANQFEICITTNFMTCIEYSTVSPRSYFVVGCEYSDVNRDGVCRDVVSRNDVSRDGVSRVR